MTRASEIEGEEEGRVAGRWVVSRGGLQGKVRTERVSY